MVAYRITEECNQCGACVVACESGAIKEEADRNVIDTSICSECGLCKESCPFQSIVVEEEVEAL